MAAQTVAFLNELADMLSSTGSTGSRESANPAQSTPTGSLLSRFARIA
jgi:hypothetical protein